MFFRNINDRINQLKDLEVFLAHFSFVLFDENSVGLTIARYSEDGRLNIIINEQKHNLPKRSGFLSSTDH